MPKRLIPWMGQHQVLGWMAALMAALWLAATVGDRTPPFRLVGDVQVAPPARPGTTVVITATVWRDLDRDCDVVATRSLVDGLGVRHDYADHRGPLRMTADGIRDQAKLMGADQWRLSLPIPAGAAPGQAVLFTELDYACNPLQVLWPIRVSMQVPFELHQRIQ